MGDIVWWQIDEPLGIAREAAHDFKSGDRVFVPDRDFRLHPGVNEALADNIREIEHVIMGVLQQA